VMMSPPSRNSCPAMLISSAPPFNPAFSAGLPGSTTPP
jgi:hypothetical protein